MSKLLLLFLSEFKTNKTEQKYYHNENLYLGKQTNDAPVKCLLKEMSVPQDNWDILCIASHKVLNEKTEELDLPQYQIFQKTVIDYQASELSHLNLKINFSYLTYKFSESTNEEQNNYIEETSIYRQLNDFLGKKEIKHVYIDYTGGLRDTAYQMVSIIQYMETRGISCQKIVYSNFIEKKIYDLDNAYQTEKLISGIKEYLNTGNCVVLTNFFEAQQDFPPTVKKVAENIVSFADAMSVCNIANLEKARNNLTNSLMKMEMDKRPSNLYAEMFKALSPVIKEKMYLNGEIDYPKMIKWCLDNRQIQQAVTLYIEKMPAYYYAKEPLLQKQCPLKNVVPQAHETPEYHGFYTDFFEKYQEPNLLTMFGQLIKNNMPYQDEKHKYWTNRVKDRFCSLEISKAFSKLTELINKLYTSDGQLRRNLPYGSNDFYDSQITQSTYLKLLNMLQNNLKLQHYLVYNDFQKYTNIKIGDYLKKAKVIERIKNLPDTEFSSPEEHERI